MRTKKNLSKLISLLLSILIMFQLGTVAFAALTTDELPQLIILQTYGGGQNQNGTPVSHSFIEIYNRSGEAVDLNGWKVVYHDDRVADSPVDWEVTLSDTALSLDSRTSFLIRGQAMAGLLDNAYMIDTYDLDLPDSWLDNKQYSVKLLDAEGNLVNEMTNLNVPNKHTSLRRLNFAAEGFVEVDYRSYSDIPEVAPRTMESGAWGEIIESGATIVDIDSAVIINQVYGRLTDGAISHGFIELYNRSAYPVNLDTYSLQYAENGDVWEALSLSGTLEPYHSFLVRCNSGDGSENYRYLIENYDLAWDIDISNRNLKIALVDNQDALTVAEPSIEDGVLDLVGAYNSGADLWDYAAGTPVPGISKQKTARRIDFANTANNADDLEIIDYRDALVSDTGITDEELEAVRPRAIADGAWGIPFDAEAVGLEDFWIDASIEEANSYADGRKATDAVHWQKINGKYTIVVPNTADLSALVVYFKAPSTVTIGEKPIIYAQATDVFASEGDFTLNCDGKSYLINITKTSEIATMFISTESGNLNYIHANKDNREASKMVLIDTDGTVSHNDDIERMNGRGNSTWSLDKKPYALKLNKATPLLGMVNAKKWVLLANHYDHSNIRNEMILSLAGEAGVENTSKLKPIDLYINNEYIGLYYLTEKIEAGDTVDITDLEKETEKANGGADLSTFTQGGTNNFVINTYKYFDIPNDPDDITGGYLLEHEMSIRYEYEASGFVSAKGQPVVLSFPEYASKKQVEYISSFYQDMEDAIYSETGYNAKGKHYTDYIDEESFVKMYLVQEFSMNVDVAASSFYLYKDSDITGDGKLHATSPWDFDLTIGRWSLDNPESFISPEEWRVENAEISGTKNNTLQILGELYKHEDFLVAVAYEWINVFKPIVAKFFDESNTDPTATIKSIQSYADLIRASALVNQSIWQHGDFEIALARVINIAERRATFLTKEFTAIIDQYSLSPDEYYDSFITTDNCIATINTESKQITALPSGTNIGAFCAMFKNKNIAFKDAEGNEIKTGLIRSGMQIFLFDIDGNQIGDVFTAVIKGDVTGNGSVKTIDARKALRIAVKIDNPVAAWQEKAADVNDDGKVTPVDARSILRVAVQIDKESDWIIPNKKDESTAVA